MKLEEFVTLKEEEINKIVQQEGVQIGDRFEPEFFIALYQLENFYVELFYHHTNNNVMYARSFTSTNGLKPYLDNIDLEGLW
ncbi:MAG: hypothetical protein ABIQ56_00880 [Chitinophagaceae bacterium]